MPVVYPVINGLHMKDIAIGALPGSNVFYSMSAGLAGGYRFMQIPIDASNGSIIPLTVYNAGKQDTSLSGANATRYQIAVKSHPYAYQLLFLYTSVSSTPLNQTTTGTGQTFTQSKVNSCRPWIQAHMQNTKYGIQGTNSYNFQIYPLQAFS